MASNQAPSQPVSAREVLEERRRERCALALSEAVREFGPNEWTVIDVSGRARVAPATFHQLFDSPDAAFAWACDHARRKLLGPTEAAAAAPGEWDERVRAAVDALVEAVVRDPALAELYLLHSAARPGLVKGARGGAVAGAITRLLEQAPPELRPQRRPEGFETHWGSGVVSVITQRLIGNRGSVAGLRKELAAAALTVYRPPAAPIE